MGRPNVNIIVNGNLTSAKSTYATVFAKPNIPLEALIVEENKKYVIKHNFDLNGQTVAVPKGCILEFDGGVISNGTLNLYTETSVLRTTGDDMIFFGTDTLIISTGKAFGDNITIENGGHIDWNILWFGARPSACDTIKIENHYDPNDYSKVEDIDVEIKNTLDDIGAVIQKMVDAGCYKIFIPANNYVWCSTVNCLHNLKLYGDFVISHRYSNSNPSLRYQNIRFGRNLLSLINMGYTNYSKDLSKRKDILCSLEMYGLNFRGLYGNEVAIISGNLTSSKIHDNMVQWCGYFIRLFFYDINDPEESKVYWEREDTGDFRDKIHNAHEYYDKSTMAADTFNGVLVHGGVWHCSHIYNNSVSVTRAVFSCRIVDSYIYNNYVGGSLPVRRFNSNNTWENKSYKTYFFDGYFLFSMGGVTYVYNNYIEYFYFVYNLSKYANKIYSVNNTYDICTSVYGGGTQNLDAGYLTVTSTLGTFTSINDVFMRINNQHHDNYESTRYQLSLRNVILDSPNPQSTDENILWNMPRKVSKNSDYYVQNSCYSILKAIPKNLTMVIGDLVETDYILLGQEIDMSGNETFTIIGGTSQNFHFGKWQNKNGIVNISAFQSAKISGDVNIINQEINDYVENTVYNVSAITEDSNTSVPQASYVNRFIYLLPINVKEYEEILGVRAVPIIPIYKLQILDGVPQYENGEPKMLSGTAYFDNTMQPYDTYYYNLNRRHIVDNLIPNTLYSLTIKSSNKNGTVLDNIVRLKTTGLVRLINLDGVENVRDIGGWLSDAVYTESDINNLINNYKGAFEGDFLVEEGYLPLVGDHKPIKYGMIYRAGTLDNITNEGIATLTKNLKVETIINVENDVTKTISGVTSINKPITEYGTDQASDMVNILIDLILHIKFNNSIYHNAALIYCQLGRDKNAVIIAILLGLLGVSESDILKEYNISNYYLPSSNGCVRMAEFMNYLRDQYKEQASDFKLYCILYLKTSGASELVDSLVLDLRNLLIEGVFPATLYTYLSNTQDPELQQNNDEII